MAVNIAAFVAQAQELIGEAAAYAARGVYDEQASANIRQVRTVTAALTGAMMAIPQQLAPPTPPTPIVLPTPPHA